ncbi:hypothetical protein PoB_003513200 [Plakobranchus ocellatus]|uniref:Uncharacterized protein n=1 Tax=Plakobranchus ocellatus TaxID=259542 RepID=A0AAV4ANX6_9GAST|nr:hypothetical protein PoB_003513200 [Plakobranchus ocellatus]
MQTLQEQHPEVFSAFLAGYHVLRQSDRFWAGLSTDIVIEQTLMRSMKSVGGLTRGRGMGDSQQTQWLLSRPACADMNSGMQEVTGSENTTSGQHAESSQSRMRRDDEDMRSILNFLLSRDPFACDETLRSISTGVTADQIVNSDRAKEVGYTILESMKDNAVTDYTFRKKEQVVIMGVKASAKVDGLLRESDKAKLTDALVSAAAQESEKDIVDETSDIEYVLDGGSLLHRIPWRRSDTFVAIGQTYVEYVQRMYMKPRIVFDGYNDGPSNKDATHLRRSCGVVGPTIRFNPEMVCSARKEYFLANPNNKQAFVQYLGDVLEKDGCQVLMHKGM